MKAIQNILLKNLLILSFTLWIIGFIWEMVGHGYLLSTMWPFLIAFFLASTYLFHSYLIKSLKGNPNRFSAKFLSATLLKLLVYIIVLVIYIIFFPIDRIAFMLNFIVLYLLYSFIEIHRLTKQVKS